MKELLRRMHDAFRSAGAPSFDARVTKLDALGDALASRKDAFADAIARDFGHRAKQETLLGDIFPVLSAIDYTKSHLRDWMELSEREAGWAFRPAECQVVYQPLGVVGILSPWNYPLQLSLVPLVAAIAAGNRAMIKPSELVPLTSELLRELVAGAFAEDEVAVITGGPEVGEAFASLPFDHLVFTGSTRVGKLVMRAASENLVPVTLELGGKSPVIVGSDFSASVAAMRIMAGKAFNAGQSCIAPDYALVPAAMRDAFVAGCKAAAAKLYPSLAKNPDYTSIVSDAHFARLRAHVDDARARGATVHEILPAGESAEGLREARKVAPTLILDVTPEMTCMGEEIFGPLLPVMTYTDLAEAIAYVDERPRPLALYYFGHHEADVARVIAETTAGGVGVNETMLQILQHDLPFGGVGPSGMGQYHGRYGFDALSKAKPIFRQSRLNATGFLRPPFRGLHNGMLSGASSSVTGSLTLLQNLRSEEAQTQAKLNELSAKFGPGYPKVAELQSSLDSTQKSIRDEAARVASRVQNDYTVAQQIEDKDRAVFLDQKNEAVGQNDKALQYQIARQEATQSRNLYENMVSRIKEADLVAGLRSSNITLVDSARVPSRPAKPNLLLYAAACIAGGILFGICGALFRDATDDRILELGEMEMLFSEASIGLLPFHDPKAERKRVADPKTPLWVSAGTVHSSVSTLMASNAAVAATEPRAAYTEALRVLCTTLMQGNNGGPCGQVLLVTSPVSGEGKSMLSTNLAIVYAQRGKTVLLVDGDLRTPVLHRSLNLESGQGLSSLLFEGNVDDAASATQIPFPGIPGLYVLPAGPVPAYPAELLASDDMAELVRIWRRAYDYIIIDGAPILPVTDSALLSRYADFTLVVARHNVTNRKSLERTCQILRSQGVRHIGMVLNGVKASRADQFRYYGYQQLSGGDLHA